MLIEKEDAIKAVCEACYMYKYIGEHYRDCKYYPCDDVVALEAVQEAPSGDVISRADAVKAIMSEPMNEPKYPIWFADKIKAIQSAEQVTGKLKNPCDSLLTDDSAECKESGSKLDLISRADAIEAVVEYWDGYAKPLDSWDVMNQTRAVLETLPLADAVKYESTVTLNSPISISAEAVQGWIPCSERLPKPWENVMTTICWVGNEYEDDYDIAVGFKKISGDWDLTLADGTGVIKGFLVLAWMPLPKPYKGGDTDDV